MVSINEISVVKKKWGSLGNIEGINCHMSDVTDEPSLLCFAHTDENRQINFQIDLDAINVNK